MAVAAKTTHKKPKESLAKRRKANQERLLRLSEEEKVQEAENTFAYFGRAIRSFLGR